MEFTIILRRILLVYLAINGCEANQNLKTSLVYTKSTGEQFSWLASTDKINTMVATCDLAAENKLATALNDKDGEWKVISFVGEDSIEEVPCEIPTTEIISKNIARKSQALNINIKTNQATLYYTGESGVKVSWKCLFDMHDNLLVTCEPDNMEALTATLNDKSILWNLTWTILGTEEELEEPIFGPFQTENINNSENVTMKTLSITISRKAEATLVYKDPNGHYMGSFWGGLERLPGTFDKLKNEITVTCNATRKANLTTALSNKKLEWMLVWKANDTVENIEEHIYDVAVSSEVRSFGSISLIITFKRMVAAMLYCTSTENTFIGNFAWPSSYDLLTKVIITSESYFLKKFADVLKDETTKWNISWTATINGQPKHITVPVWIYMADVVTINSTRVLIQYIPKIRLVNSELSTKLYGAVPKKGPKFPKNLISSRILYIGSESELLSLSDLLKSKEVWEYKIRSQTDTIVSPMPHDIKCHLDKDYRKTNKYELSVFIPAGVRIEITNCGTVEGIVLYMSRQIKLTDVNLSENCRVILTKSKSINGTVFQKFPFKEESCLAIFELCDTPETEEVKIQPTNTGTITINYSALNFIT